MKEMRFLKEMIIEQEIFTPAATRNYGKTLA